MIPKTGRTIVFGKKKMIGINAKLNGITTMRPLPNLTFNRYPRQTSLVLKGGSNLNHKAYIGILIESRIRSLVLEEI